MGAGEERRVSVAPGSECALVDPVNGGDPVDLGPVRADRVIDLDEMNGGAPAPPASGTGLAANLAEGPRALVWPGAVIMALAVTAAVVWRRRTRFGD